MRRAAAAFSLIRLIHQPGKRAGVDNFIPLNSYRQADFVIKMKVVVGSGVAARVRHVFSHCPDRYRATRPPKTPPISEPITAAFYSTQPSGKVVPLGTTKMPSRIMP